MKRFLPLPPTSTSRPARPPRACDEWTLPLLIDLNMPATLRRPAVRLPRKI